MKTDISETWAIYMKLCEEFPELYDIYVDKIEKKMKDYQVDPKILKEAKKQTRKKLSEKFDNET